MKMIILNDLVLEFWGFVDREIIEQYDTDIPKELKDVEQTSNAICIVVSYV